MKHTPKRVLYTTFSSSFDRLPAIVNNDIMTRLIKNKYQNRFSGECILITSSILINLVKQLHH